MNFPQRDFESELQFKSSLSSGKGGQHVNKTSSRISLFFNIENSHLLSKEEKDRLIRYKGVRKSKEGIWQIDVEKYRSQLRNKKEAIKLFYEHLEAGLKIDTVREKTKIPKAVKEKRLKDKKAKSKLKESRKKDFPD